MMAPPMISVPRDHQFAGSLILQRDPPFDALRALAESRSEPIKAQINILVSSR